MHTNHSNFIRGLSICALGLVLTAGLSTFAQNAPPATGPALTRGAGRGGGGGAGGAGGGGGRGTVLPSPDSPPPPAAAATVGQIGITKPIPAYQIGADISAVQAAEDRGVKFSDSGVQKDILQILKDHGFNYVRLRVFNDPTISTFNPSRGGGRGRGGRGAPGAGGPATTPAAEPVAAAPPTTGPAAIQAMRLGAGQAPYSAQGYCDLAHTIAMAKRAKAAGMGLLIDFHYSDSWADPGKQFTPTEWFTLSFPDLVKKTHDWTKDCIQQMKDAGCLPEMVQVGNEITPGMMNDRPDGGGSTRNWDQLAQLLQAGSSACTEVDPRIIIVLHIDKGGDNRTSINWYDNAISRGVKFDVVGQSTYTQWQGQPEGWKANFEDLAKRYPHLYFISAEVADQVRAVNDAVRGLPDHRGLGSYIWEPTQNGNQQGLFTQAGGRGGRGFARGGTTAPATAPVAVAPPAAPPATPVSAVISEKMGVYDQMLKDYGIKR